MRFEISHGQPDTSKISLSLILHPEVPFSFLLLHDLSVLPKTRPTSLITSTASESDYKNTIIGFQVFIFLQEYYPKVHGNTVGVKLKIFPHDLLVRVG